MDEPLFITDLLLAAFATASAAVLGVRAARPAALGWPLRLTVALLAGRLVVAALLWREGWELVGHRLTLGLPVAVLPVAATVLAVARNRPAGTVGQVAAVGVFVSAYLAWVPQDPAAWPVTALVAAALLGVVALLAVGLRRWRAGGSRAARLPWQSALVVLALAASLGGLQQQNAAVAGDVAAAPEDWGGGPRTVAHHGVDVASLTGPEGDTPAARFTLVAAHRTIRLASGRQVDALTFNGTSPGPTLRVRQGELVEVTLVNTDVTEGVTVHWHGVDVPNAEDGVPGLTQDAVPPGGRHVYRFVPDRAGTFWYHTHRDSQRTVARGLFGAFLVDPPAATSAGDESGSGGDRTYDTTLFTHQWLTGDGTVAAFNDADAPTRQAVAAGREVLLRLVNSSEDPQRVQVGGVSFRVRAIDGNPVHEPGPLPGGTELLLAAGGRYDVGLTMPAGTVTVSMPAGEGDGGGVSLALSPSGQDAAQALGEGERFDPAAYGTPDDTAPPLADRSFDLVIDTGFGFADGGLTFANTVDGRMHPAVPTLMVALGDSVRVRIVNRGIFDHPMHLHGHRVRVVQRDGSPVTGSPWWTDTLNVAPGESYEVAFTADNPGIWMDHCHNFTHAAEGMVWHLAYAGVTTARQGTHGKHGSE
ncbi:multicopper oxidase domain-containing protein [Micromonospora haikouensis]|uniref:multicopper oxidase domain-containing protein n=1 Tax=Micromonospora haikouensis TaxID=686309 RepID=UPI003410860D